jgi:hypothetical protein
MNTPHLACLAGLMLFALAPASAQSPSGAAPATDYLVQRALTAHGPWVTLPPVPAGTTRLSDTGLAPDTEYFYRVRARNASGASAWTGPARARTHPGPVATSARLVNVSSRLFVAPGKTAILGFVANGTRTARVLIRAVGPGLATFGVRDAMGDPQLAIFDGAQRVAGNNDWDAALADAFAETGAFGLSGRSADAALIAEVTPGRNFSVHVSGRPTGAAGATEGVVLIEIYELPAPAERAESFRFGNVSLRAESGPGERVLILGFGVGLGGQRPFLVRAVGPTLAASPFGIPGMLADPALRIFSGTGTLLLEDDNWRDTDGLAAVFNQVGAFALPASSRDAALLTGLSSGSYTVHAGSSNLTTGEVLVELYQTSVP